MLIGATELRGGFRHLARHLANGADRLPAALLKALDDGLDLGCGFLGAARQGADLIGHHGKAPAGFTGARGLNSCVQSQQVGLLRDGTDH